MKFILSKQGHEKSAMIFEDWRTPNRTPHFRKWRKGDVPSRGIELSCQLYVETKIPGFGPILILSTHAAPPVVE